MFTGSLEIMSRAEAKVLVENLGGKIASNVSKNLNYLIIGNKPTIRKLNEARDLKINILNEKDWNPVTYQLLYLGLILRFLALSAGA